MAKEYFLLFDSATGAPIFRGDGPEGTAARQVLQPGWVIICVPAAQANSAVEDMPLPILSAAIWDQVKAKRDLIEYGGAEVDIDGVLYSFDTDERSQNLIGRGVLFANALGAAFSDTWTMADNQNVTIDQAGMLAIGLALGAHVSAVRARARELRDTIDGAADLAALLSIDIHTGWPT